MGNDSGPVVPAPGRRPRHLETEAEATPRDERDMLASIAADAGLRRIHFVAWRDLDDPEAGGSELHAHMVASLWAAAGLDVTFRTSAVHGESETLTRDGYRGPAPSRPLRGVPGCRLGGRAHGVPAG